MHACINCDQFGLPHYIFYGIIFYHYHNSGYFMLFPWMKLSLRVHENVDLILYGLFACLTINYRHSYICNLTIEKLRLERV